MCSNTMVVDRKKTEGTCSAMFGVGTGAKCCDLKRCANRVLSRSSRKRKFSKTNSVHKFINQILGNEYEIALLGNEYEPNPLECHFRYIYVDTMHNCLDCSHLDRPNYMYILDKQ